MRFRSPKVAWKQYNEQRISNKIEREGKWHQRFAWKPVLIKNHEYVWLTTYWTRLVPDRQLRMFLEHNMSLYDKQNFVKKYEKDPLYFYDREYEFTKADLVANKLSGE